MPPRCSALRRASPMPRRLSRAISRCRPAPGGKHRGRRRASPRGASPRARRRGDQDGAMVRAAVPTRLPTTVTTLSPTLAIQRRDRRRFAGNRAARMPRLLSDTAALPCLLFAMVFDAAGRGRLWEGGELPEPVAEGFLWLHL